MLKLNTVDGGMPSLRLSLFSDALAFESAVVFIDFASFGLHGIILKAPAVNAFEIAFIYLEEFMKNQ